ncbi:MAG TPA: sigma-54 dependent transcriptional regulator [Fimbriimonadaceae bacterium]|nr:sigma-54 dependent transcriptional regulator [Fimbriimonadaceae bacterium]
MSERKRLLIVDDEPNIRRILQAAFEKAGLQAVTAEDGRMALMRLGEGTFEAVLTDVTMPGMTGYELLREVKASWPETPVVIMTAFGTIPQAVQAIRDGAFEYVTKPFDLESLKKTVMSAIHQGDAPAHRAKRGPSKKTPSTLFVADSPVMREVRDTIQQVADSRATVLVTGESGTGKEVAAKLLHELSPRADKPFVAVSCAALPESLLESELFGYEKGAFTGAQGSKTGRFEAAHGGTLFLDEIGEIPLGIQVKLLRVLQERQFERLGSNKPTVVDVRLVTATNRDLQRAVEEGSFRLDLLYRLQVVELHMPPLRDRGEDILRLAETFLRKHSEENGRHLIHIGEDAAVKLQQYSWPGNVRELENTMERAVVLASREDEVLLPRHLPAQIVQAA